MAKQFNSGNPFDNLSYSEFVPTFVGAPVNDIKALNEKKEKDYYDTLNATEIAKKMADINVTEKDRELLSQIQGDIDDYINNIMSEGDLENKTLAMRKYMSNLANNSGLKEMQQKAANRQAYIDSEWQRYQDGKISKNEMETNIQMADKLETPITKNEITGKWEGNYSGRKATNKFDVNTYLVDLMAGKFKADGIDFVDSNGNIMYDTGNGYFVYQDGTQVDQNQVAESALLALQNNPDAQDWLQSQVYLNHARRFALQDKEPTAQDVANILKGSPYAMQVLDKLGLKDASVESVQNILNNTGKSAQDLIGQIDTAELLGSSIVPITNMEAFTNISPKFLDNWLLKEELKFEADKNKPRTDADGNLLPTDDDMLSVIMKIESSNKITKDDINTLITGAKGINNEYNKRMADYKNNLALVNSKSPNAPPKESLDEELRQINELGKQYNNYRIQIDSLTKGVKNKITQEHFKEIDSNYQKYLNSWDESIKSLETLANQNSAYKIKYEQALQKPKLSKKEFEELSLQAYIGDSYNWWNNDITDSFEDKFIRKTSNYLEDKLGSFNNEDAVESSFIISDLDTLKNSKTNQLNKQAQIVLQKSPNQFSAFGRPLETLVKEDLGIDMNEVDLEKSSVNFTTGLMDGKPKYILSIYGYTNGVKNPSTHVGNLAVNSSAFDSTSAMNEVILHEGTIIKNKKSKRTATTNDDLIWENLSKHYANISGIGKSLDDLNIYVMNNDELRNWEIPGLGKVNIHTSPSAVNNLGNKEFYISNSAGKYYGFDENGKQGFYDKPYLEEKGKMYVAPSGEELKSLFGEAFLNESLKGRINQNQNNGYGVNVYSQYRSNNTTSNINFNKLIQVESGGNPNAVSSKGAVGLTQVLSAGHSKGSPLDDYNKSKNTNYSTEDLKDPAISVEVGKWYFDIEIPRLLKSQGFEDTATNRLMAYNWGIGNMKKWKDNGSNPNSIPQETINYINKITKG